MTSLFRVVQIALSRRLLVAGVLVCSLLVAAAWCANIATVYPVVAVLFQDKSIPQWADEQAAEADEKAAQRRRQIDQLHDELRAAPPEARLTLEKEISLQQSILESELEIAARSRSFQEKLPDWIPRDTYKTLVLIVVVLLGVTLFKVVVLILNTYLVERLANLTVFDLRKQFYRNTLRLDLGAFGRSRTADLMARFTNDMNLVNVGLGVLFGRTVLEPMKMIAYLVGASFICWRLLLLSLITAPLAIFLVGRLAASIKRASRRALEEMSILYNHLSETFAGVREVKAYTMEPQERNRFHQTAKQNLQKAMRIALYNSLARPLTELMGIAIVCLAMLAGGYLVINQETHLLGVKMCDAPLSYGAMLTFFAFLVAIADPGRKLADVLTVLQRASAAADRIYQSLDREPAIVDPEQPRPLPSPHREIVFDHVDFHYTPDQPVLHDICLRIKHGQSLAIVGPNGCGKSTLVNLIPRFYDPTGGDVRLDDVSLRDLRIRELRSAIGVVTQQPWLFNDTVMNNIRYGSPGASDDEVIEAAKKAHAHRFITEKLTAGYQSLVGERGGSLSGGQRQRIALARAILRDPEVLILDEATSQIDIESEQLIHQALQSFVRGRTSIMITHRTSTLALADQILVLDAGRIVDLGAHDELLDRCELYQGLYRHGVRESA